MSKLLGGCATPIVMDGEGVELSHSAVLAMQSVEHHLQARRLSEAKGLWSG